MIKNSGFGIYASDDYPEPDFFTGPRPKSVFTGTSPVEQAVLAGLPSVEVPEPATNHGTCLFGSVISCPVRLNGAPVLRCPLDGAQCMFFLLAQPGRRARIDNPKRWTFLLDLTHQRKWLHPGPACLENRRSLCNGLVPTCQPYQGVSRAAAEEGFQPFGCKAYQACWNSWRLVKEFPGCIQVFIEEKGGLRHVEW